MRRFAIHLFVFLGAVLLFGLEPLVGRMLLPRFGGGFLVWTSALMFFQGALFVGYLYAHLLSNRIGRFHLVLVAIPLLFLPPTVGEGGAESGVFGILALLVRHIACPFIVLATTAVVAQRWWASSGREPYGLYAVSNAGSLGALVGYALIVEPFVGLAAQRWIWMLGYFSYALLAVVAWHSKGPERARSPLSPSTKIEAPRWPTLLYWGLLSAAPSAFLLAVTNLIALDAGSVPLVWVVPLAIYLGSFVVAFAPPRTGDPSATRVPPAVRRLWPHIAAVGLFFFSGGDAGSGWIDVAVHLTVLAVVCLAAHAELHRVRPAPRHLTLYYLVIALGGWIGGSAVALVSPVAFDGLYEYPIALVVLALAMAVARRDVLLLWLRSAPRAAIVVSIALVVVIVAKVSWAAIVTHDSVETLAVRRSFYGVYRVTRTERSHSAVRDLVSGNTRHGLQHEGDTTPLSYYHRHGPLGDALSLVRSPRRIGAVGLGVGTAAGHLSPGDRVRFFEIDDVVAELAREHFTYLSGSQGEVDVVVGDARVSLEREAREGAEPYDLLLVDAFAGDAIPTHLLTTEAVRVYLARLTPGGILLFHVSNRYYDLRGVLRGIADRLGLYGAWVARMHDLADDEDPAQYVALSRRPGPVRELIGSKSWSPLSDVPAHAPWTDDHVDVLSALLASF